MNSIVFKKGTKNMKEKKAEEKEKVSECELSLDELDNVSGGSLRDVVKEKTKDIDDDLASRI